MDEKNALSLDLFGKTYEELDEQEKRELENILNTRKREMVEKEV